MEDIFLNCHLSECFTEILTCVLIPFSFPPFYSPHTALGVVYMIGLREEVIFSLLTSKLVFSRSLDVIEGKEILPGRYPRYKETVRKVISKRMCSVLYPGS
jgi:hypothetical protein